MGSQLRVRCVGRVLGRTRFPRYPSNDFYHNRHTFAQVSSSSRVFQTAQRVAIRLHLGSSVGQMFRLTMTLPFGPLLMGAPHHPLLPLRSPSKNWNWLGGVDTFDADANTTKTVTRSGPASVQFRCVELLDSVSSQSAIRVRV